MTEGSCVREDLQTLLEASAKSAIPPRRKEDSKAFRTQFTERNINEIIGVLRHREHGELPRVFFVISVNASVPSV